MIRLTFFCLCVALVWTKPTLKQSAKVVLKNLPGPRIVGGDPAELGQFPYQAAVANGGFFCGGSIISEEWILTAAHCLEGAMGGFVLTGSLNPLEGNANSITDIIIHEEYDNETLANDIGLARLYEPLIFDENTGAISIAHQHIHEGQEVTVSGWGLTSNNEVGISVILNFINLVTISNEECKQTYGEQIFDEMVCAVSDNDQIKSICGGDSGGPVVIHRGGEGKEPLQVAIASFGPDSGCETGAPTGYTRVAPYIKWIQSHIQSK